MYSSSTGRRYIQTHCVSGIAVTKCVRAGVMAWGIGDHLWSISGLSCFGGQNELVCKFKIVVGDLTNVTW